MHTDPPDTPEEPQPEEPEPARTSTIPVKLIYDTSESAP
jgi:hypothetical protein